MFKKVFKAILVSSFLLSAVPGYAIHDCCKDGNCWCTPSCLEGNESVVVKLIEEAKVGEKDEARLADYDALITHIKGLKDGEVYTFSDELGTKVLMYDAELSQAIAALGTDIK